MKTLHVSFKLKVRPESNLSLAALRTQLPKGAIEVTVSGATTLPAPTGRDLIVCYTDEEAAAAVLVATPGEAVGREVPEAWLDRLEREGVVVALRVHYPRVDRYDVPAVVTGAQQTVHELVAWYGFASADAGVALTTVNTEDDTPCWYWFTVRVPQALADEVEAGLAEAEVCNPSPAACAYEP